MALTTFISLVIPDLGKVFELTGALAAYPIDFVLPSLVYIKICYYDVGPGYNSSTLDPPNSEMQRLVLSEKEQSKFFNLLKPQVILPTLMIILSVISSVVSLYVIISGTDWAHLFGK